MFKDVLSKIGRCSMRALAPVVSLCVHAHHVAAQDLGRNVRVFFDCNADCDGEYVRLETPWADFVRDRTDADVHLLVTSLGTGAGGQRYTLNFVGLGPFLQRNDTLIFARNVGESDDVVRSGLTRMIQLGLAPYVARTPSATHIAMELDDDRRSVGPSSAARDPWNAWVFDVDAHGGIDTEERQERFEWGGSFDANRITRTWKFGSTADAFFEESRFKVEDDDGITSEIKTVQERYSAGVVLVRSHGAHWGSGAQATVSQSTFSNTKLAIRAGPAVEYSVFPYSEFTGRQLVLQYSLGLSRFEYAEETIFNRFSETRPTHALVAGYNVTQRWGEADLTVETARYFDNSAQWRFSTDGELEFRIARGLSIDLSGSASWIRDQLSIAKRGATPEEVLLDLRELRSDYRYDMRFGLSYTFGSIFSAVVNPRFGTGPGNVIQ